MCICLSGQMPSKQLTWIPGSDCYSLLWMLELVDSWSDVSENKPPEREAELSIPECCHSSVANHCQWTGAGGDQGRVHV